MRTRTERGHDCDEQLDLASVREASILAHREPAAAGRYGPGKHARLQRQSRRNAKRRGCYGGCDDHRRPAASRPLKTSKIAHPSSATAQSFHDPNHSRFGVPWISQTINQIRLAITFRLADALP